MSLENSSNDIFRPQPDHHILLPEIHGPARAKDNVARLPVETPNTKAGTGLGKNTSALEQQRKIDWDYRNRATTYNRPEHARTNKSVETLVGELGAKDYKTRDRADKTLESIGIPALSVLKSKRNSIDPEINNRANILVARIEEGAEFRSVLVPGKDVIRAYEALHPAPGKDLPANWSQLTGFLISSTAQIDRKAWSKLSNRMKTAQPAKGAGLREAMDLKEPEAIESVELADVNQIGRIMERPHFEAASALIDHPSNDTHQQLQRMRRGTEMLTKSLERGEIKLDENLNNDDLYNYAANSGAIKNPRFLMAYTNAVKASGGAYKDLDSKYAAKMFEGHVYAIRHPINILPD